MADNVSVKITGIPEAIEKLKKYQIIKRGAIEAVLKETGAKIEGDAKKGPVPVDTGRLRASITHNWSGSNMSRATIKNPSNNPKNPSQPDDAIGAPQGPKGLVVVVGSNVAYAKRWEYGFKGKDKLGRKYNQEGRFYLSKAYYKNEGEALSRIKKVMKQK